MKYRGKRLRSMLLCAALIAALLPARASAAFEHMAVERKLPTSTVDHGDKIQGLKDGEVYTYTEVSLQDPAGNALPETDFSVSLAAVGQKYPTMTTTIRPTVTVLVLDTSSSMNEKVSGSSQTRMKALQNSAESFLDAVVNANNSGTNYVAVVTYATRSYKELDFTNHKETLTSKIKQMTYRTGDDGGTNTHGGLIAAYKMISTPTQYGLSQEQVKNAVYSVVFMSDGAPTFYTALQASGKNSFSKYDKTAAAIENTSAAYNTLAFDNGSSGVLTRGTYKSGSYKDYTLYVGGPGTASDSNTVDNAKTAAAILKQTNAAPNVYSIYLKNSDYDKAQETMDAIASSKKESFTPEKTTELTETFQNIAVSIKSQATPPIAEVVEGGGLSPVSYVDMSYNLGSGYTLVGNTMQVSLGDTLHTLTRQTNGTYKGTADSGLAKLEVKAENGVVNFRVPASLLPCNEPEPKMGTKTVAKPIKLFFTLRINPAEATKEGVYPTASASTARFYPTAENPFYYGGPVIGEKEKLAENVTVMDKKTTSYAAMYSNPSTNSYSKSTPPKLRGFAVGESSGTLIYQLAPDSVNVSQYSDYNNASIDTMTLIYQDQSISFVAGKISFKTARADFNTTNDSNPGAYTVSNFSDGTAAFSDAVVSSVSNGSGTKKNITVSYDGGKRTIEFKNVSLSKTTIYGDTPITAEFKGVYGSNNYIQTLTVVKVNGDTLAPSIVIPNPKEDSWSSGYDYFKNIIVEINGKQYLFDTIKMSYQKSPSYAEATGKEILGQRDTATSIESTYYYAETNVTVDVPRKLINYQFDTSIPAILKVQTRTNGTGDWSTIHTHVKSIDTEIVSNQYGGYTVTSTVDSTRTIVVYSVENDMLYRQVTTETVAEINEGWVTQSHTEFGSITLTIKLTAGDIITSAELTSLNGTKMAVANSSGSADLLLTLVISGNVSGISGLNLADALKLSVKSGDNMPGTFAYEVKGVKKNGAAVTGYTGTLLPGTYQITLSTKSIYSNPKLKPGWATVSLDQIRFTINDGANSFTLQGSGQSVKLVLVTTTGH